MPDLAPFAHARSPQQGKSKPELENKLHVTRIISTQPVRAIVGVLGGAHRAAVGLVIQDLCIAQSHPKAWVELRVG